ncbi:TPA: ABC transporter ATP-binding protein [Streptococcus suis]|uniref:ABC transporter related protein n=8 Tax=Streptococcus suis TaxID=1307 RepID=D5AHS5_STRGZ|nr:ABC transporter ATP-binding protein [Streptococcus suis]ABP90022.1 ABC-type multidrug transport system, ATPase and permease component [Streptococcus suis 05ZYH33]ABP92229.1 ABC-type multidrug transport system, ATPase and permease component [Streptococcus suis 98HAH33]ADE31390.1 ABC transporter related protein [Streptococcus suis GZ1]ADV70113.1 ABC-type multidrug transport system, ATPase and permease component [Streptococcus suis JS14]AER15159.1 ABC-type multidrug transport system, ATPase an
MKFLSRYFKDYIKESILGPVFKLLEACFELLVPLIIAYIVDTIIPNGSQGNLVAMLFLLVGIACIGIIVSLIAQYYSAKAAVGVTKELTNDLYQKVLSLPKSSRDILSSSSLLTRLTSDTLQIQTGINTFLRLFLRAPIVVFGSLIMAFYISPSLSAYFLGMIILLIFIVTVISVMTSRIYQSMRKELDGLVGQVRETVTGWRVIRAYGQREREIKAFQGINQIYKKQQLQAGFWSSLLSPLTFLVVNSTLLILIWQGNIAISHNLLEQGMLVALINYLLQILVELVKMIMVVSTLNQTYISAQRIQEVFDQTSEDVESSLPKVVSEDKEIIFSVRHLSFSYPKSAEESLSDITFDLRKEQFMGIIGGTGSGKSTLVDLLQALYSVPTNQLSLFIDGKSPKNLKEWRQRIAIVPQQAQLFAGTIRSNLSLGLEEISDSDLWSALEIAQAKSFIEDKGGLDSPVEAFGKNFSSGQRQRLTIARAILQKAPILILDDATSALDYLTESRLLAAIRQELPGQNLIMVSQRTNSLRTADQILVLEQGRQVGLGRHEDLLRSSAIYQEIHQSQQQGEEDSYETI